MTEGSTNSDRFDVRPATTEDLDAVSRLAGRLLRQHHAWDSKRFLFAENPEGGYRRFLASEVGNDAVVLLAAVDRVTGDVVGYAYARMEPRSWVELRDACGALHDIYVDDRARRFGVARTLVDEVVARLGRKGAPRVVLHTAWQNEAGQALFRATGFRPTMIEMTRECDTQGPT